MKKLLTGIVVLSLASMAFAVSAFEINDGYIEMMPGLTLTVPITVTGATDIAWMLLNLEISPPFEIVDLAIDTGTIFQGNTTYAEIYTQFNPLPIFKDGFAQQLAVGYVETQTNTVNANPGIVALVTILEPVGTIIGTQGFLTTGGQFLGNSEMALLNGEGTGCVQGWAFIQDVPEPASALLLLAGLSLIRRRHTQSAG